MTLMTYNLINVENNLKLLLEIRKNQYFNRYFIKQI